MAQCKLYASCFFYNDLVADMPHSTEHLREKYCEGDFNECARFKIAQLHGQDYVPKYMFPNDLLMALNFNLPETRNFPDGIGSLLKVLNIDGTFGTVSSANLCNLLKTGSIAAYHGTDGWVEVRRKISIGYSGPERRVHNIIQSVPDK